MKRSGQVVLALTLALITVFAPVTAFAAGWKYSNDGQWGVNILLPKEGQTIYSDVGFTFEFEAKRPDGVAWDYAAVLYRMDSDGYINEDIYYEYEINAYGSDGHYTTTLGVSNVEPGNYLFMFAVGRADGSQVAVDTRNVTIVKRSGGWEKFSGGWSYKINGNWVKNKWELISGKWYRFNSAGYMLTNWQQIGGKWYYLGSDGAMRTSWQAIGGKWYCFSSSGEMYSNCWLRSNGYWYLISKSGAMLTGWQKVSGSWYYFQSGGRMETGWLNLGGKWYFLDSSGKMVTGTRTIYGTTCTFNSSGVWIS